QKYPFNEQYDEKANEITIREPKEGYELTLSKVRLGQGAFRVMVIDAYNRKCAISGEKTLPVLESSHIKPFSKSGPHLISNALLLRSDLHKLYDSGYMTITPDYKVEISKRIHTDFNNGKEYYKLHGTTLVNTPTQISSQPAKEFLVFH